MLKLLMKIAVALSAQVVCGVVFYVTGLSLDGWGSFWARFFFGMWILAITDRVGWTEIDFNKLSNT